MGEGIGKIKITVQNQIQITIMRSSPEDLQEAFRLIKEHNAYCAVKYSKPKRPRTTGPRSEEAHVRGHCESISRQVNGEFNPDQVLEIMKGLTAMSGRDYPEPKMHKGVIVYASNADLSVEQERSLIETIHQYADEQGMWLIEYTEEKPPRSYKTRGGRSLMEMMAIEPELNPEHKEWYAQQNQSSRENRPGECQGEREDCPDIF